ncbi:MAG TPA: PIG-L family deacetylase, partial [Solirubrobacterales bacterium]|nr:PIG-L family deacetylase [Solirubrobacterales bacterium]
MATLWVLFLLVGSPASAGADPLPECTGRSMYVVAHEDDSLIFQSPALLQEIRSGRCIQTVYLTAGDAGKDAAYWEDREAGNEAAYAQMAGVPDEWTQTTTNVGGHPISSETLDGQPRLSLVYLRLPDGNITGEGFPAYGNQSLLKLWRSANPNGSPSIPSMTAVDGSTTYSYAELIATLTALIAAYQPQLIATQNYAAGLPPSFPSFDHPDHLITAYMVRSAQESYAAAHQLIAYKGYDVSNDPQNVTGTLLGAKQLAFYTYGAHDPETCVDEASCSTTLYGGWLKRQVRTATATTGVVADAGYAQEVIAGTKVSLDGSASSAAGGKPLTYFWTQTKGPPVTLSSATA